MEGEGGWGGRGGGGRERNVRLRESVVVNVYHTCSNCSSAREKRRNRCGTSSKCLQAKRPFIIAVNWCEPPFYQIRYCLWRALAALFTASRADAIFLLFPAFCVPHSRGIKGQGFGTGRPWRRSFILIEMQCVCFMCIYVSVCLSVWLARSLACLLACSRRWPYADVWILLTPTHTPNSLPPPPPLSLSLSLSLSRPLAHSAVTQWDCSALKVLAAFDFYSVYVYSVFENKAKKQYSLSIFQTLKKSNFQNPILFYEDGWM